MILILRMIKTELKSLTKLSISWIMLFLGGISCIYAQKSSCSDVFHLSDSCLLSFLGKTSEQVLTGLLEKPTDTGYNYTMRHRNIYEIQFTFETISPYGNRLWRRLLFRLIDHRQTNPNLIPPLKKALADSFRFNPVYYYPTDTNAAMQHCVISSVSYYKGCTCFSPVGGLMVSHNYTYYCGFNESLEKKRCTLLKYGCAVLGKNDPECGFYDWCFSSECTKP